MLIDFMITRNVTEKDNRDDNIRMKSYRIIINYEEIVDRGE